MPQLDTYNLSNWSVTTIFSSTSSYSFFVLVFLKSFLVAFTTRLVKFVQLVRSFFYLRVIARRIYRRSRFKKKIFYIKKNRRFHFRKTFLRTRKKPRKKTNKFSLYFLILLQLLVKTSELPTKVLLNKKLKLKSLLKKKNYVFSH